MGGHITERSSTAQMTPRTQSLRSTNTYRLWIFHAYPVEIRCKNLDGLTAIAETRAPPAKAENDA